MSMSIFVNGDAGILGCYNSVRWPAQINEPANLKIKPGKAPIIEVSIMGDKEWNLLCRAVVPAQAEIQLNQ